MAFGLVFHAAEEERLLRAVSGPTGQWLSRTAALVETAAKSRVAVDTGRLRSSITWTVQADSKGLYALVGSSVSYAIYQELGTRFMPAHPFLVPGLRAVLGGGA